jgi:hypothetical protein
MRYYKRFLEWNIIGTILHVYPFWFMISTHYAYMPWINTTCATSGEIAAYPSWEHPSIPVFFLGIRETQIVGFCVVYCGSLLVFFVPFWTLSVLRFTASDFECFLNILNSRNTYCFPEFQINNKFLYIKYSILLNISVVIINMDSLITFRGRHGRVSIGSTTSYAISAKYH